MKSNLKRDTGERALAVMGNARVYNEWLADLVRPFLKGHVLEVGAGVGNMSPFLYREGVDLTVCDVNENYLRKLKEVLKGKVRVARVDLAGGAKQLPLTKHDTVICFNVLEHVEDNNKALLNMKGWLKKGGRLLLLVPAHQWLYSKLDERLGHFRRYTKSDLERSLSEVGFRKMEVEYVNWVGALGWLVFVKLGRAEEMPMVGVRRFNHLGVLFRLLVGLEKLMRFPFGLSVWAVAIK